MAAKGDGAISMPLCLLFLLAIHLLPISAVNITLGALVAESGKGIPSDSLAQRSSLLFAAQQANLAGILPNGYNIVITPYNTQGTAQYAVASTITAINAGVTGLIGASTSATAQSAQYVAQVFKIPQVGYASTSPDLASRTEYPDFLRVVPSDVYQSTALAALFNFCGWPEVSIISSDDSLGRGGAQAFIDSLVAANKVILTTVTISSTSPDQQSIDLAVQRLKSSGARVFYINMFDTVAKLVFRSAAKAGIMGPRYVWLASGSVLKSALFRNATGQVSDPELKAILHGVVGTNLWPGGGTAYDAFVPQWEALDPTQYPGAGTSNIPFYVPYAYDSVFIYAHALATMINGGQDYTNGTALLATLQQTTFTGLTGPVALSVGERTTARYDVINIVDGIDNYVAVGTWDSNTGLLLTNSPPIVWADGSTIIPQIPSIFAPIPPDYDYVAYSDPIPIVLIVLTSLLAIVIVLVAFVLVGFFWHPIVKDISLVYSLILLFAMLLCCFMLYPFFGDPDDASCAIRPWTLLPFLFLYSVLVHRIYVIIVQRFWTSEDDEKKVIFHVKYHWWSLPIVAACILAIQLVYLIIWTAVDRPYPQTHSTYNSNEETTYCQSDAHWVWIGLQAAYIVILSLPAIGGAIVIWIFRVNTMWNEGRFLATAVLVEYVWVLMFIIPAYVARASPDAWIGLIGFGIWTTLVILLVFVFGSQLFYLTKSLLKKKKDSQKREIDKHWRPTESTRDFPNELAEGMDDL